MGKKSKKCLTKKCAGHNLHMVSRIRNSNSDFSSEAHDPPPWKYSGVWRLGRVLVNQRAPPPLLLRRTKTVRKGHLNSKGKP